MIQTGISVGLALTIALAFGVLLGRAATQWSNGRALANLLMEIRGAFLPFLVVPVIAETWHLPGWLAIGTTVGTIQAISVGRWIARRTGEWSPSLLGGIALGRSRAALLARQAMARGAVTGTIALTFTQVVVLEALTAALALPHLPLGATVGGQLYAGAGAKFLLILAVGSGAILATELATSWLLQRRPRSS